MSTPASDGRLGIFHKLSEQDVAQETRVLTARILMLDAGDSETLEVSLEHNQVTYTLVPHAVEHALPYPT